MSENRSFRPSRRAFLGSLAILSATPFLASAGLAASKPAVFTIGDMVGAGGYDVVAYQTENAAVEGKSDLVTTHDGVTYRFSSAANRDAFVADPARYLPQFGGYCAYAVSKGYTAKIDPEAWSVVDGKLYLNYSKSVRALWNLDKSGHIASANANWPKVLDN